MNSALPDLRSFPRALRLALRLLVAFSLAGLVSPLAFAQSTPLPVGENASADSYQLRSGDTVVITIYGEPELAVEDMIDASGQIRLPLLGAVKLARTDIRTAETVIEEAFVSNRFLRDPQVQIRVAAYAPQYVSILGQVKSPRRIRLADQATEIRLIDAVSEVGGLTGIAKTDAVRITRAQPDGTEATFTVDLSAQLNARSGSDQNATILQPGDVVFIPERLF